MVKTEKFIYGNLKNNETFEGSVSFDDSNSSKDFPAIEIAKGG